MFSSLCPQAVWDWQNGSSQGWKWDVCQDNKALTGCIGSGCDVVHFPLQSQYTGLCREGPWYGDLKMCRKTPARTSKSCEGKEGRGEEQNSLGCFPWHCQCVHPEMGTFYGSWFNRLKQYRWRAMGMALPLGSSTFW